MEGTGMVHRAPPSAVGVETEGLRKKLAEAERERDLLMQQPNNRLDGYRELGAKCASLGERLAKAQESYATVNTCVEQEALAIGWSEEVNCPPWSWLGRELAKARADAALQHASAKDLARQFNEARAEVASIQRKTYAKCIRTCECLLKLPLYNEDFKEGVRRCKGMHQAEMENGGPLTTPLD